ncbi:MAG TPA: PilZ domain-containing protein [Candidatus Acidoferrales bacterium]|nr:PilZ domain-containing protein [Candidatus Acidoferrales bacterium]
MNRYSLTESLDAGARFPERRTVPRYALVASIEIFEPITNTRIAGETSEISVKGCYMVTSSPLAINTVVQLRVQRAGSTFETWGRIANIQERTGMGLAFFQSRSEQEKVIAGWITELSSQGEQSAVRNS